MAARCELGPNYGGSQIGENRRQVNNHYHQATEAQPDPFSTVPFTADSAFVNRPFIDELHSWFHTAGSWLALVGIGGVGYTKFDLSMSPPTDLMS